MCEGLVEGAKEGFDACSTDEDEMPGLCNCSDSESESFEERDSDISDEGEEEPEDGKSLGSDDSEDSDEDGGMSEYSDESIVYESEEDELDRLDAMAEQVHHAEKRRRVK